MFAEVTVCNALKRMNSVVDALSEHAPDLEGRGIVICAGGPKYFVNAWVGINMLRHLQCNLTIELWHLGPAELTDIMRELVDPLRVTCVDASDVRKRNPVRLLSGWELKPFSIIHSRFRHILLLDADNVPVVNPNFLFDSAQLRETGAVFWPGARNLGPERSIWPLTGVPFRDEPEVESGQIVIDKARCWKALALTMWMNEHSDFWYRHIHGDKETFHMAWRKLGQPYSMPQRGIQPLAGVMCQYDFEGRRIFQHRTQSKWRFGANPTTPGFDFEDVCQRFIDSLEPHARNLFPLRGQRSH